MKEVYGYIRVSTAKQGQGVSLQEQKSSIIDHAKKNNLDIVEWFEEKETAAKRGRPVFTDMLDKLRGRKVSGVVIHKIDRSARNLKDWAELGELLDNGIEVHFAHESLDLHARGGRLSADIQAVIAADYIRNLREETKKGFYGRLKQGIYPLPAPVGYLDQGSGRVKIPDPQKADFIKKAFELYATGEYGLDNIASILTKRGFRNIVGGKISRTGLSNILHNPFYMGIIRLKQTNETFNGIHKPLVSKYLFDKVQDILAGKRVKGTGKHDFIFRRLFSCKKCGYSLIGEKQKGLIYYRCHSKTCRGTCVRQESIEKELYEQLKPLDLCKHDIAEIDELIDELQIQKLESKEITKRNLQLQNTNLGNRLDRLTDAFIDGDIDKESYLRRKKSILLKTKEIEEELSEVEETGGTNFKKLIENLELLKSLYSSYFQGLDTEKRYLLKKVTSNLSVYRKKVVVELQSPFQELSNTFKYSHCTLCRTRPRRMGKFSKKKIYQSNVELIKKKLYQKL